jgi:P4 family phage/plasmid primase-like protien
MPEYETPGLRFKATTKTPDVVITTMATDWQLKYPDFQLYNKLNFTLTSVKLVAGKNKKNELVKTYKPLGEWKNPAARILKDNTHYAILTGKVSGISVVDIDDPDAEHNKQLMDLLTECNMVAKTNKGYHYVFNYTDKLTTTTGKKLDTRNDGGIIFCSPTRLESEGKVLASYEWVKEPFDDEGLTDIPQDALEYLYALDSRYVNTVVAPQQDEEEEESVAETIETVSEPPVGDHELIQVIHSLTKRYENYADWLTIGIVCYNEKIGVEVWENATKAYYKRYAEGKSKRRCIDKWATFGKDTKSKRLTGATLWLMLKKDNPARFYELMETRKDFLNMLMLLNSNDVAKYFYNIYPDKYIYNEHMGWYSINPRNIWEHSEKNIPSGIKGAISNTFQQLCLDTKKAVLTKFAKDASKTANAEEHAKLKKECDDKISLIHKSYKTLGGADFCSGVISFLDTYYIDPQLDEKLDMNPNLFAFNDGVYDLTLRGFRPITPTDYISTTTGYDYPKRTDPKIRAELDTFLYNLFEDKPSTQYLLQVLSSCLLGYNKFEKFYVFTGSGGNGKGVITELITKSFGKYFKPVNVSLFTKIQERLDQPIPALVEARNGRVMMASEPENSEKIQVSILKKITGGDPMEARTLHSKHIYKYKPPFKVFFQCNDIPKLSKVDTATQRRMEVIKFPFNFVANPILENERQGDPDVKNIKCSSDEWRDEFMLIMVEVYQQSVANAKFIVVPNAVKGATDDYIDDNNPLKPWLNEHFIISKNEQDTILARELKAHYMEWAKADKTDDRWFKQLLKFNGVEQKRTGAGSAFLGIRRKPDTPQFVDE